MLLYFVDLLGIWTSLRSVCHVYWTVDVTGDLKVPPLWPEFNLQSMKINIYSNCFSAG